MLVYVPFNDEELIFGAERMARGDEVFVHGVKGMSLNGLAPDAVLYLLAHGRYSRGDQICGEVPGRVTGKRNVHLTAAQLAKQLSKDGLPKTFGDLRLLVCWGGYVGGTQEWGSHTLKRDAAKAPFAGQLCSAMKTASFTRIIVSGYTGTVMFPKKGKVVNTPNGVWLMNPDKDLLRTDDTGGVSLSNLKGTTIATDDGDHDRTLYTRTLDTTNRTVWY